MTKPCLRLPVVAALFVACVVVESASASAADSMAIVNVNVRGDTQSPNDLAAALRRGLISGGFAVATAPLDASSEDCAKAACLGPLARTYKADLLAWATIQSSPQNYEIQIRVVSAASEETMTVDRIKCGADDLCPPMPQTLQRLGKEVARKVRARKMEMTVASASEPEGLATPTPTVASAMGPTFAPPRVYAVQDTGLPTLSPGPLWTAAGSTVLLGISGVLFATSNVGTQPEDHSGVAIGLGVAGFVGLGVATAWWLLQGPTSPAEPRVSLAPFADHQSAGLHVTGRWQ
jgi:hypothetical protein